MIFEDSQEFLQKLFDIAKKRKHIYFPEKDTSSTTTDRHNTVYNYK